MLSEKLAATLSEKQLRSLLSMQSKKANTILKDIRTTGAAELSGVYTKKYIPYLEQYGTKSGTFRQRQAKTTTKKELITQLLNIQYFNENIISSQHIKELAQEQASRVGIDVTELKAFWQLVKQGLDASGYRVDSEDMVKIVSERMRAGQSVSGIKAAITRAAKKAKNGTEYITKISEKGRFL